MMNVKGLRKLLEGLPEEHLVILAKDGEGNNFSPLSPGILITEYVPESTWSGTIRDTDEPGFKQNAVVLWPIN